jgi:mannose-6-phosphate isomerase-like protein (cupin superfamily)
MSTVTATKPYRLASGEGLADVWWMTGRLTVKAGPDETGNAFSQFEVNDPRGSAPPLHVHHNEDEAFYVLDGEVTVLVGDERIDLGPATTPSRRAASGTRGSSGRSAPACS